MPDLSREEGDLEVTGTLTAGDIPAILAALRFLEIDTLLGTYTMTEDDMVRHVDSTGGDFTVTLLNPTTRQGMWHYFWKVTAGNIVTFTPASGTINGGASLTLATQYTGLLVWTDGTEYFGIYV